MAEPKVKARKMYLKILSSNKSESKVNPTNQWWKTGFIYLHRHNQSYLSRIYNISNCMWNPSIAENIEKLTIYKCKCRCWVHSFCWNLVNFVVPNRFYWMFLTVNWIWWIFNLFSFFHLCFDKVLCLWLNLFDSISVCNHIVLYGKLLLILLWNRRS